MAFIVALELVALELVALELVALYFGSYSEEIIVIVLDATAQLLA
jgi:hypothetical protein